MDRCNLLVVGRPQELDRQYGDRIDCCPHVSGRRGLYSDLGRTHRIDAGDRACIDPIESSSAHIWFYSCDFQRRVCCDKAVACSRNVQEISAPGSGWRVESMVAVATTALRAQSGHSAPRGLGIWIPRIRRVHIYSLCASCADRGFRLAASLLAVGSLSCAVSSTIQWRHRATFHLGFVAGISPFWRAGRDAIAGA